jgi:hypothetical protein
MAQTTLVVVWAICLAFVRWRWFWGRWRACVDGGGGQMGWELWELFVVVGVIWHFFSSGAHDHMVCARPQGI